MNGYINNTASCASQNIPIAIMKVMFMLFALLGSISLVSCIHPKYLYRDTHSRLGKRDGSMILPLEQNDDSDEDPHGGDHWKFPHKPLPPPPSPGSPRDRFGPNKPPPPGFMDFFPFASDESIDIIPFDDGFSPNFRLQQLNIFIKKVQTAVAFCLKPTFANMCYYDTGIRFYVNVTGVICVLLEQSAWMDKDYSCRSTECSKEENAWYACVMLSDACMERMAPMVECDEIKQRCIKLKALFARCFNECTRVEYDNLKKMVKNIRVDQPPPQPRSAVKRQNRTWLSAHGIWQEFPCTYLSCALIESWELCRVIKRSNNFTFTNRFNAKKCPFISCKIVGNVDLNYGYKRLLAVFVAPALLAALQFSSDLSDLCCFL
ncbi:conserved hypothetical protein [Trichinella spiralis]|uniref:hypothetical protein n=1 Tax=Trichinella spiralis TaxID=6334 RepID=UPI0001EFBF70|nr:conserved hypothetical protein [Trichinella spiralis]